MMHSKRSWTKFDTRRIFVGTVFALAQYWKNLNSMKQFTLIVMCALLAGLWGGTSVAQTTVPKGNTQVGIGKPLPDFSFTDVNGQKITKASLPAGMPVIVFYFDPDCDHCQQEAAWITQYKEYFKGITFVWVSWGEMDQIKAFPAKHLPGVTGTMFFTKDTDFKFDTYFGYSEIPSIYVYNKSWVRTASFREETKPEFLVKFAWQQ
jgi:cytochrome oxidase Cu insertion factor (SCO1/SenC/PrrC family)